MLSKFSVKKPYTVLVAVAIVIVLGALSFQNMSTDFLPDMEFPYAIVMTTYAGASPEEVERAVTEPIEQSMSSINNVKKVQSMSINNMSVVIMEFNEGTDMGTTVVDMRESLDMATARWDDGIGSPTIMKPGSWSHIIYLKPDPRLHALFPDPFYCFFQSLGKQ